MEVELTPDKIYEKILAGELPQVDEKEDTTDYGIDEELENKFFRRFKRHPSWFVLEYREQYGEHHDWPQYLRDILATPEVPEPKKIEAKDWETEKQRVRPVLWSISARDRDEWIKAGMAIHHACGGSEDGKAFWDEWSKTCPDKYDQDEQDRQWGYLNEGHANPISLGWIYFRAKELGYKVEKKEIHNLVKVPGFPFKPLGPIAHAAHEKMREDFKGYNHNPSNDQYMALREIMVCCEAMVKGAWHDGTQMEKKFYLSSIDPGVGKTKSFCRFIAQLLKVKDYKHVGIIVCVGRLNEIRSLFDHLKKLGVNENQIGIYTAKGNDVNDLGNKDYTKARILLTTQQMIDARLRRAGNFSDIPEFQFNGRARKLRIWDEAILPGRQLTIGVYKILAMLDTINNHNIKLASTLLEVAMAIKENTIIDIPEFRELYNVSESEAREWFAEVKTKVTLDQVSTLWQMSGKTVNVVKEKKGMTALSYEDTLPEDMKPVLVLDASGRVRHAYEDWANSRNDIIALYPGTEDCIKDYSRLTVHHWNKPGGKGSFEDNPGMYADAISRTINSKPVEEFLVVHHINMKDKKGKEINFQSLVSDLIEGDQKRVSYIHWGDHSATNEYAHIPNVIFAGIFFQPESYYHSLKRLAERANPEDEMDKQGLIDIKKGENAHGMLQAACRGLVRKSEGVGCPESNLYIISEPRVAKLIDTIFPGCVVKEWNPLGEEDKLTPKQQEALSFVLDLLKKIGDTVSFQEVYEAIGIKDRNNFRKLVMDDKFASELKKHGIIIRSVKGRSGSYFDKQLDGPISF